MADAVSPGPAMSESLSARSIRFAITVTAPIALNLVLGPQPGWFMRW